MLSTRALIVKSVTGGADGRGGIIWRVAYICSFPKCGRTWVQHVLAHVINDTEQRGIDVNTKTMFDLVPIAEQRHGPQRKGVYLDHSPWNPRFANEQIVFLLRCPMDTLVSFYYHRAYSVPRYFAHDVSPPAPIEEVIPTLAKELTRYYQSWETHTNDPNVLVVRYEDLVVDASRFVPLVQHLGIPCTTDDVLRAVTASAVDKMRSEEQRYGLGQGVPAARAKSSNEFRVRVAQPGSWKKELRIEPALPRFALLERYGYVR